MAQSKTFKNTILIPKELLDYYKSRTIKCKSRKNYFTYLILTYRGSTSIPNQIKIKNTLYQQSGFSYVRINFNANPLDWEEYRILASHLGVSICYLFIMLMRQELRNPSVSKKGWNSSIFHLKLKSNIIIFTKKLLRREKLLERSLRYTP